MHSEITLSEKHCRIHQMFDSKHPVEATMVCTFSKVDLLEQKVSVESDHWFICEDCASILQHANPEMLHLLSLISAIARIKSYEYVYRLLEAEKK